MKDEKIGAVFSALGDETRRKVVTVLTENGAMTATEIAEHIPVTRQAITKHLSTLGDAGLVAGERDGREVRFHLTPEPMSEAVAWMAEAGSEWDARLKRLKRHLTK
ncbi:MAG: ArsR/SmtB family transcription factor [Actinomycetota bacterium]|nr:metalloregulator ArsR/SmtB family transcription factor [Actinomycetota bacterium]